MKTKHLTLSLLLLISAFTLFAQPEFDDDIEDTPISGITELIVISGMLLGIKQGYFIGKTKDVNYKKKNK
jgi:hypothetical protein